jgi:SAM-dependent methyltransferase
MYNKSSKLYDLLYGFKNYEDESSKISEYILEINPNSKTILDIACGTGIHAHYLSKTFIVDGIDLNSEFVKVAAQRNINGNFRCKDMTDFKLENKYDVVMCLFSSIAYARTLDKVEKAINCFREHLSEDGIILIEPWFTPDQWQVGRVDVLNAEDINVKVCRMTQTEQQGNISVLNFQYLVGSKNGIKHFRERHELGLFTVEEIKNLFARLGMECRYDPEGITGRGVYLAKTR